MIFARESFRLTRTKTNSKLKHFCCKQTFPLSCLIDLAAFLIRLTKFLALTMQTSQAKSIFICFLSANFLSDFRKNFQLKGLKLLFEIFLDCIKRSSSELRNLFINRIVVSIPMSYDSNKNSFWYTFFSLFYSCVYFLAGSGARDEFLFMA